MVRPVKAAAIVGGVLPCYQRFRQQKIMIWIDDEGNDEDEEEEEEEEEEDEDDDAAAADDDSDDDNDHYYSVGFANTKAQQLFCHELMQFCRREYSLCSGHAATC